MSSTAIDPKILALIPKDAVRVQVADVAGVIRWRNLSDLESTDSIRINPNTGIPYTTRGQPGRKPKTQPTAPVKKIKPTRTDEILSAVSHNVESADVLHAVIRELADETSSLKTERMEFKDKDLPTSQVSLRRVQAIRALGDLWLRRKEQIASREIDMDSPVFQSLFLYVVETFHRATVDCGIRPEMKELLFSTFSRYMEDPNWKTEAKNRMRGGK